MTSRILIPISYFKKQHYEYHITNNKREFIAKVRNKSFIVMTFLSPLLFVAIAAFVGYLSSMKADTRQIAFMMHQVYLSEISLLKTVKKRRL
jgi:ABC-2 type transport system permease protein